MLKKINYILIAVCILSASNLFGQGLGYFGKKNMFNVSGVGSFPLYSLIMNEQPDITMGKVNGNDFQTDFNLFTSGYCFSFGRSIGNGVIGLTVRGLNFKTTPYYEVNRKVEDGSGEYYSDGRRVVIAPYLKSSSFTIIPTYEHSKDLGLSHIGLVTQYGLGYTEMKLKADSEEIIIENEFEDETTTISNDNLKQIKEKVVIGSFATFLRIPVKKALLLQIGFRYSVPLYTFNKNNPIITPYTSKEGEFTFNQEEIIYNLRSAHNWNFLQMEVGVTVPF